MRVKDFQFIKYLLTNEIDLPEDKCSEILETEIEIIPDGDPDLFVDRGKDFRLIVKFISNAYIILHAVNWGKVGVGAFGSHCQLFSLC